MLDVRCYGEEATDWDCGEGCSSRTHRLPDGTDHYLVYGLWTVLRWERERLFPTSHTLGSIMIMKISVAMTEIFSYNRTKTVWRVAASPRHTAIFFLTFPTFFFVVPKLFRIFANWKCVSKYYDYDKTYNETIPDAADNAAVTSAVTCDNFMYDR